MSGRDQSFVRAIGHLANFIDYGGSIPSDAEVVIKFKTQRQALEFEASLKGIRLSNGQSLLETNETPGKDRLTLVGISIKIAHPDVQPYPPMIRNGEKA